MSPRKGSLSPAGDMTSAVARLAPSEAFEGNVGTGLAAARQGMNRALSIEESQRLRGALHSHFALVWRSLRRFGVDPAGADDGAQHVFLIFSERLADIRVGAERAFLLSTCVRVAANVRRLRERRGEVDESEFLDSQGLTPEELLECKQQRQHLDRALLALSAEQRHVFVLHELEGFSLPEIAASLAIPIGTATSRLRRARLAFEAEVSAMAQRGAFE